MPSLRTHKSLPPPVESHFFRSPSLSRTPLESLPSLRESRSPLPTHSLKMPNLVPLRAASPLWEHPLTGPPRIPPSPSLTTPPPSHFGREICPTGSPCPYYPAAIRTIPLLSATPPECPRKIGQTPQKVSALTGILESKDRGERGTPKGKRKEGKRRKGNGEKGTAKSNGEREPWSPAHHCTPSSTVIPTNPSPRFPSASDPTHPAGPWALRPHAEDPEHQRQKERRKRKGERKPEKGRRKPAQHPAPRKESPLGCLLPSRRMPRPTIPPSRPAPAANGENGPPVRGSPRGHPALPLATRCGRALGRHPEYKAKRKGKKERRKK